MVSGKPLFDCTIGYLNPFADLLISQSAMGQPDRLKPLALPVLAFSRKVLEFYGYPFLLFG